MHTNKTFQIIFILLFISIYAKEIATPKRDSFVPINSNTLTLMELKDGQRELYFTFDNKFENSDIVVNLKKAKQYTTRLYFYDSYESIKTNSNGEYIDFIEELDLSEKLLYLKGYQKKTYYIVIKDLGNYSAKDYFSIYNEQDTLQLKEDEPFTINLFLSKNLYKFEFSGEKDEVISLDMNINNKDFSETIAIYLNDELIYMGEKNRGLIKLNEDKTTKGTYTLYVSSTNDEVYTYIKSSIVIYKEKDEVLKLEPEKEVNLFYVNSKAFSFYVDLNDYELTEQNIITFKFSHTAVRNNLIEYCYAKNMNFKEFDSNKFISNMPAHEEESEANFSRLNSIDNVYHLYFAKTQKDEEDKNSYLLVHCNIKIDEDLYYDPEKINVYLSQRATTLDFTNKKYFKNGNIKLNQKVVINDYIPKVYRIKIPMTESSDYNRLAYIFYTNIQIQTVYEDSMITANHENEDLKTIYAFSTQNLKKDKTLYIKLFGAKQEINFRAETTIADIYYLNDSNRPNKILSQQHLNCGNSFYYIGSYSILADDLYFYLEEIYGKYNLYYKNSISDSDDDSILTNGNSKYLVNSKTGTLTKSFDIIELKCETPGFFNFHLLKTYFTRTLTMYQRQVAFASKGDLYIYPKASEGQTKINLEISTPLDKEVEINYNNKKTTINSKNKYFQLQFKKAENVPNYIKMNVKEDKTLLSIRLTDGNLYKIVENNRARINEERILFKLDNNQNYKNVNITLNRVSHDYTYTMFRGDISYAVDPIVTGYEMMPIGDGKSINLILSNPNLKINTMTPDKSDSPFYIMFYVYDPEGVQKDIYMEYTPVEKYEEMPNSVSKVFDFKGDKYSLNINKDISKVSVIYQDCGNALKEVNIYSYDDILNSFEVKNKYNLGVFNKYQIPNQVGPVFDKNETDEENDYKGAVVGIGLKEVSQKDIDEINKYNYGVRQNGKVLKWEKLKGVKNYVVYIFNKENEDIKYINNPCYLDYVNNNNLIKKNENDTDYVANYTTNKNYYEVKEKGIYMTTVLANLEGNIPMKYVYNALQYNSSSEPYDEGDDSKTNTLLILLLVFIPIIIILIVVLIILLIRKNKQKEITNLPEERTKLIRDTTNSNSISGQEQ